MPGKKRTDQEAAAEAPRERAPPKERSYQGERSPENVIFVGNKDTMNYVVATVFQFNKSPGDISIKARGRAISKAVDVVEIARTRFLQGKCKVKAIEIGTEAIKEEDGRTRNVSTISITVQKE